MVAKKARGKGVELGTEVFCVLSADLDEDHDGKVCGGGSDPALPEAGLRRAQALASLIKKSRAPIQVLCSSPLLRAIQTADTIHDFLGVKLRVSEALRERRFGSWEGKPSREISNWPEPQEAPPGGESTEAFRARVQEAVQYVREVVGQSGSVLLVSHPHFFRAWTSGEWLEPGVLYRLEAKADRWVAHRV